MSDASPRHAEISRQTKETSIKLSLDLDGSGKCAIKSGVGFLDHMLTLFTVHSRFDVVIDADGDTDVDDHHTVEDIGICLGQALKTALGDMAGICRYGHGYVPMDETLARACVDISNRPYLHWDVALQDQKVGTFDTQLAKEFMRALVLHGGLTLHIDLLHGENTHHIIEAIFKASGRALAAATAKNEAITGQLSSKGML